MKKIIFFFAVLYTFLYSCQGNGSDLTPNPELCYFAVDFSITSGTCVIAGGKVGIIITFVDENGQQFDSQIIYVSTSGGTSFIGLPPGHTYNAWVVDIDQGDCGGCFDFYINVDRYDNEGNRYRCDRIPSHACTGRLEIINEDNPDATFTLPEICDGKSCPEIDHACDFKNCGGLFFGTHTTPGYYTYPEETLELCKETQTCVYGDPVGVPNRFTLRKNGVIIDAKWVGDYQTYPSGPWGGGPIPYYYNYSFVPEAGATYTLQVETVVPLTSTDSWNANVTCGCSGG